MQNSFTITFSRCPEIRRKANNFEDLLNEKFEGHYGQPQIIPVPDELDPEIPRLIFGSRHGFSQIIVTQIGMTLNVTYSPNWQMDTSKGKKYMLERTQVLFYLHKILENAPICFSGFTTRVRIKTSLEEKYLLKHLQTFLPKNPAQEDLHDINVKYTSIIGGNFFSNITVQNYRNWLISEQTQGISRLSVKTTTERGVEILGDFNDRYSFNEKEGYFSSSKNSVQIIEDGYSQIDSIVSKIKQAKI